MTTVERVTAAARIKTALRTITGRPWSAIAGRGRGFDRITVQAPISRRVGTKPGCLIGWEDDPDAPKCEKWFTSLEDCQALSAVFGCLVYSRGINFMARNWDAVVALVERKAAQKPKLEP